MQWHKASVTPINFIFIHDSTGYLTNWSQKNKQKTSGQLDDKLLNKSSDLYMKMRSDTTFLFKSGI